MPPATRCALGFRIKSGWATTVLLGGAATAPKVLDRRITLLADPMDPEARQPYHAGLGTHEARAAGHRVRGVGIVVGSVIDPARIPNEHIRAHAEEGRLFRTVVEQAIRACRLRAHVMVEKELYVTAARFRRRVAALGEHVDGPWRAEEKAAALAAWMVLRSAT